MGISSPGIGSGLDVAGIISKLMAVEAAPLAAYDKKAAAYQSKLNALGTLGTALGAFQGSLTALSTPANFRSISANSADTSVLMGSATSQAVAGIYNVNVTRLAQSQTLNSAGLASTSAEIGTGASTTLTFQLGTVSGGAFGLAGSALGPAVVAGGISNGSLTINGAAIATDGTTKSAKLLADAINAKSGGTGVTATAGATSTSTTLFGGATSTFGAVATDAAGSYALSVGGVQIAAQGGAVAAGDGVSAASIDATLGAANATTNALTAANITFTGTAAAGTLQFFSADGSNLNVSEAVGGVASGGIGNSGTANAGSSVTATSAVTLSSATASPITIGGSAPAAAGLTAGSGGAYLGASFAQDGAQASGTVIIDATNHSLQGIRDAINKAGIGVTASIVSDGSATPNHLVLTSTKTGASSAMKISLSGAPPDAALNNLLAYDPAGAQKLSQTSAAQSTMLSVNGIAVSSATNNVTGAIQGVTLTVGNLGSTSLVVAKDSSAVKSGVSAFVKAYNDLNKTIKDLTSYDPQTKKAAVLLGDSTTLSIQTQLRKQLTSSVTGLSGNLTTLSQIGISAQKDGSLALDSTKLQKAITDNFSDIGGLFAAVGTASDSLASFISSTTATKPGTYALNVTTLASQGTLKSAAPLAASTVIGANTSWSVTLNQTTPSTASKIATVSLTAGTYTATELSALLRSAINGNAGFAGAGDAVETSVDGAGFLNLASSRYGSVSNIGVASLTGTAVGDVFGAAVPAAGVDVAGTLGGVAATGSGQTLTGAAGSPTDGLKLEITGGAAPSERGTVSFSQGYAYQLNNLATSFLGTKGMITGKADGLNLSIKSVSKSRDTFNDKLADIEKRYRAQFTALDSALSAMQTTSSYLTQQLAAIAKN